MSMRVAQSGVLSLLQDSGRYGQHRLGLSNGGPMDREAFHYCNRLLQNSPASTAIEISVGGLQLESLVDTYICLTGAPMPLSINGQEKSLWAVQRVYAGDIIQIGFARSGCRSYFGVADGFTIETSFGSTATVVRENIGGLRGHSLQVGDQLPCPTKPRANSIIWPTEISPAIRIRSLSASDQATSSAISIGSSNVDFSVAPIEYPSAATVWAIGSRGPSSSAISRASCPKASALAPSNYRRTDNRSCCSMTAKPSGAIPKLAQRCRWMPHA